MRTIHDLLLEPGAKVIVRTDFDVPVQDGTIQEEFRVDPGGIPTAHDPFVPAQRARQCALRKLQVGRLAGD